MPHIIKVSKDSLFYANPTTKKGRESYVRFDERKNGWVFDYGQAWINLKPHEDINVAIADMKNCTEIITGAKKIPKSIFEVI